MKRRSKAISVFNITYAVVLVAYLIYVCFLGTDIEDKTSINTNNWSDGWITDSGSTVSSKRIKAYVGDEIIITKKLPVNIKRDDSLCFMSHNANLVVTIGGEIVYSLESKENLTGYGYADMKHDISLKEDDSGKEVEIHISSSFKKKGTGYIEKIYLGNSSDYTHYLTKSKMFPSVLSSMIVFFGILMVCVYLVLPKNTDYPYNIFAFGLSVILMGYWCLVSTGYLQLITGNVIGYRVVNYLMLQFAAYPVICFGTSFLVKKNKIYQQIGFVVWFLIILLLAILRFVFGVDMHNLMNILYASYVSTFAYLILIFIIDIKYCNANNIKKDRKMFSIGSCCVIGGALTDIILYLGNGDFLPRNGTFIRLGLICFIFTMLTQFLYWWTDERKTMQINDFINKILKYAVSSDDPEDNINKMLEFIGQELKVDRTYIFEETVEGDFVNTYEWHAEGCGSKTEVFDKIPIKSHVIKIFEDVDRQGRAGILRVEDCKEDNPQLYELLKSVGINNTIAGALNINGEYKGVCGVDNVSYEDNMEDVSKIINVLSYFFGQLILQRDNNRKLIGYGYNDLMTDVGNRRAFERFEDEELDKEGTYGFVMCDINGLKTVNDNQGHEAGDALIKGVCQSLVDTFGKMNVFRMGGDEFVVVSHVKSEGELEAKVNLARKFIEMEKRSASIGYVFCENGNIPYEEVKIEADKRMYQEKQLYYSGRNERRKRD